MKQSGYNVNQACNTEKLDLQTAVVMVITKPHSIAQSLKTFLGAVFKLFKQMVKRWEKEERSK